jgi:hypothetical protein
MKAWNDMTKYEQMRCEYSDLHKDVFGMRPSPERYAEIAQWSDSKLETEFDLLVTYLNATEE